MTGLSFGILLTIGMPVAFVLLASAFVFMFATGNYAVLNAIPQILHFAEITKATPTWSSRFQITVHVLSSVQCACHRKNFVTPAQLPVLTVHCL